MSHHTEDLVRRLRKFGERWPHEEATAGLCREAANELERLKSERDEYARVALVGLSGFVPTPEKGYVADGGPGLLAADLRAMRAKAEVGVSPPGGPLPLPAALRSERITEADVETLFRIASDPDAKSGVRNWVPARIPKEGEGPSS